jgi:quinol monooxygenase YgiN
VIFITAKFKVKAAHAEAWADLTREFTEATRAEPGNLSFEWSRSLDDPTEYVLVEAFRDGDAGGAHVQSAHFAAAMAALPQYLVETPKIVSQALEQDDWSELSEMRVD